MFLYDEYITYMVEGYAGYTDPNNYLLNPLYRSTFNTFDYVTYNLEDTDFYPYLVWNKFVGWRVFMDNDNPYIDGCNYYHP